jgi:hypothetical protein
VSLLQIRPLHATKKINNYLYSGSNYNGAAEGLSAPASAKEGRHAAGVPQWISLTSGVMFRAAVGFWNTAVSKTLRLDDRYLSFLDGHELQSLYC